MGQAGDAKFTDMKPRYGAGVLRHRQMGDWEPGHEPKNTDIAAVSGVSPQDGIDPQEAAAAVGGGISTPIWTKSPHPVTTIRQGHTHV